MTYKQRILANKAAIGAVVVGCYVVTWFVSGWIFHGIVLVISPVPSVQVPAMMLFVRLLVFVAFTFGMVVMVFLKLNKDVLMNGWGVFEIEREINLLESAKQRLSDAVVSSQQRGVS